MSRASLPPPSSPSSVLKILRIDLSTHWLKIRPINIVERSTNSPGVRPKNTLDAEPFATRYFQHQPPFEKWREWMGVAREFSENLAGIGTYPYLSTEI